MPTADEMLAGAVEEQYILVDLNTRLLNIPKSITNIGVESDDDVLRLPFKMPRYLGEFDLSEFKVRVNYLNAKKLGDLFEPDDITVTEDGYITFTWLVGRYAAAYKGNVSFNVCLKKYDEADPAVVVKEFNSTIAILPVLEGLETAEAVAAAYVDILEAWKTELFNIYEDIENAVDEYIASLGVSSVISVNGKTGTVNLTHKDVGAAPADINYADVGAAPADINYADVGAAPAGYGLGADPTYVSDANTCKSNGWFYIDNNTANKPPRINYAVLFVYRRNYAEYVQEVIEVISGLRAVRNCHDGATWSEWAFENPSMDLGVEYRTTDRIGGNAVYKKNVDGVIHYRLDGETTWQPYAKAGGGATVVTYTAWLNWDGWSSTAPYTQTVSAPGVLASDTPLVDIRFLDSDTTTTSLARLEAWACVDRVVAGDGTLTLYAYEEKPGEGFSINVMVVR